MSKSLALLLAPVLLGAGFFLGRAIHGASDPDAGTASPGTEEAATEPGPTLRGEEAPWQTERRRRVEAEAEVARLKERVQALEAGRTSTETTEADATAAQGEGPDDVGTQRLAYAFTETQSGLEAIDWEAASESVVHITPIIAEVVKALASGEQLPPSFGDVQRWNGPLVKQALIAQQSGIPGSGINGTFSHPSVVVNMVHATLARAGVALDERQERQLGDLGMRSVEEDRMRLQRYDESTPELKKVLEETQLKDRLYAAIDAMLTEPQREALHPAEIRGRVRADLFCSGIVWLQYARNVQYADRNGLTEALQRRAARELDLDEQTLDTLRSLSPSWAASFSDEYLGAEMDAMSKQGLVPVERVRIAAERQLAFTERMLQQVPPSTDAAKKLRENAIVLVPLPQSN